ncbi:Lrp/AsnC family transcriptional regulator [Lysinibacillus odysseyi]|uniref:AsnC family transcriptional regulator n=1 Tax=Lysinibacillus odysseyi 34hs-1 = NBRC 100172 TaxID=1220589 RepID=A0A0A3II70_9BACI|nr:Lrp/AsnC family transcriptional regulator [Lysinibacillus odysseyi]KGR84399.1 AsnC family transcriptional regulator [Lysinibacillus odysseyi 34hs-1 = NBRC 100172]
MDAVNEMIIEELKKDSRISMSELGRRVHLSPPAVRERVRQLEEQGIIKGFTIALDIKKMGYPIEAIIEATIKNNRYNDFKQQIQTYTNIDFCYRIAGEACFLLKAHFQTFVDAETFIDELQPFAHTKTNFVFSEVARF